MAVGEEDNEEEEEEEEEEQEEEDALRSMLLLPPPRLAPAADLSPREEVGGLRCSRVGAEAGKGADAEALLLAPVPSSLILGPALSGSEGFLLEEVAGRVDALVWMEGDEDLLEDPFASKSTALPLSELAPVVDLPLEVDCFRCSRGG